MNKSSLTGFFIVVISVFNVSLAQINIPNPTSEFFVNDFANVISSQDEQAIFNMSKMLYEKSGNSTQVVVVTIDSLEGNSLEEYANRLFNIWGIGSKEKNDGVLLLLSVGDRQSRIEVGYGLEDILPDGKTGRIQDEYMIPHYKSNDFSNGLKSGCQAIINVINGDLIIEAKEDNEILGVIGSFFGYILSALIMVVVPILIIGYVQIVKDKRNEKIVHEHFNVTPTLNITDELEIKNKRINKAFFISYCMSVIVAFVSPFIPGIWPNITYESLVLLIISPLYVMVAKKFCLEVDIKKCDYLVQRKIRVLKLSSI